MLILAEGQFSRRVSTLLHIHCHCVDFSRPHEDCQMIKTEITETRTLGNVEMQVQVDINWNFMISLILGGILVHLRQLLLIAIFIPDKGSRMTLFLMSTSPFVMQTQKNIHFKQIPSSSEIWFTDIGLSAHSLRIFSISREKCRVVQHLQSSLFFPGVFILSRSAASPLVFPSL